jgi:tetrapyrrole methylase family protein / MazG family protein
MASDPTPLVTVVGLGPAGPEFVTEATRAALAEAEAAFLRTARHPAAAGLGPLPSMDRHYEEAGTFDEVYTRIVEELVSAAVAAADTGGRVVYAVPGSPLVAERTVELLRADGRVLVTVVPAPSFLDLAWERLGVDPLAVGVRLVDGTRFAEAAAGERGPLLVAQCWSPSILSEIKLAVDTDRLAGRDLLEVTILHHLGLPDQRVLTVPWEELDRAVVPDHLTSLWIPELAAPVAGEFAALEELVRRLRRDCPWDREQTHASLTRHLLEESYEVIDAVGELDRATAGGRSSDGTVAAPAGAEAAAHLEEELGDLLFQVAFHSRLATEEGWFTLADVAQGVHDKLVARHPHVFGDVVARDAGTVVANWEEIKKAEKGRTSVTDGIPNALPALALAAKLARKADGVPDAERPTDGELRRQAADALTRMTTPSGGEDAAGVELGELLWCVADLGRRLGIDPEDALRAAALRHRERIREAEGVTERPPPVALPPGT